MTKVRKISQCGEEGSRWKKKDHIVIISCLDLAYTKFCLWTFWLCGLVYIPFSCLNQLGQRCGHFHRKSFHLPLFPSRLSGFSVSVLFCSPFVLPSLKLQGLPFLSLHLTFPLLHSLPNLCSHCQLPATWKLMMPSCTSATQTCSWTPLLFIIYYVTIMPPPYPTGNSHLMYAKANTSSFPTITLNQSTSSSVFSISVVTC